ncbi:Hypothetical protein D9617_53g017790 [Elsinoe fawcettii]|nr:Hypothetical protein D9617_53g017790 [Elsinoe fawcettii]
MDSVMHSRSLPFPYEIIRTPVSYDAGKDGSQRGRSRNAYLRSISGARQGKGPVIPRAFLRGPDRKESSCNIIQTFGSTSMVSKGLRKKPMLQTLMDFYQNYFPEDFFRGITSLKGILDKLGLRDPDQGTEIAVDSLWIGKFLRWQHEAYCRDWHTVEWLPGRRCRSVFRECTPKKRRDTRADSECRVPKRVRRSIIEAPEEEDLEDDEHDIGKLQDEARIDALLENINVSVMPPLVRDHGEELRQAGHAPHLDSVTLEAPIRKKQSTPLTEVTSERSTEASAWSKRDIRLPPLLAAINREMDGYNLSLIWKACRHAEDLQFVVPDDLERYLHMIAQLEDENRIAGAMTTLPDFHKGHIYMIRYLLDGHWQLSNRREKRNIVSGHSVVPFDDYPEDCKAYLRSFFDDTRPSRRQEINLGDAIKTLDSTCVLDREFLMDRYLITPKPFDLEDLASMIRILLDSRESPQTIFNQTDFEHIANQYGLQSELPATTPGLQSIMNGILNVLFTHTCQPDSERVLTYQFCEWSFKIARAICREYELGHSVKLYEKRPFDEYAWVVNAAFVRLRSSIE